MVCRNDWHDRTWQQAFLNRFFRPRNVNLFRETNFDTDLIPKIYTFLAPKSLVKFKNHNFKKSLVVLINRTSVHLFLRFCSIENFSIE